MELAEIANINAPEKRIIGRPFQKGQIPNPQGRPKGSRNKLGESFVEALHADFQQHGPAVIERVREEKPDQYLKVIAMIVPKELHVRDQTFDNMTDEELADLIAAIRISRAKVVEGTATQTSAERSDNVHGSDVPEIRSGGMPSDNRGTTGES